MTGWKCPGCSRCYAPHVDKCGVCGEPAFTLGGYWRPTHVVPPDVCGICGNLKSAPAGTGCGQEHYGTYCQTFTVSVS